MNNLLIIKDILIIIILSACGVFTLHSKVNNYKNLMLSINILMILFTIEALVTIKNYPSKDASMISNLNSMSAIFSVGLTFVVTIFSFSNK